MAIDELLYDPEAIDGSHACIPACINQGVCQNKICFCLMPYGGDYCEVDLGVTTRLSIELFIAFLILGLIIGFMLVFFLRFAWDCIFYKEKEPLKEDEDAWQA
ncbi:hypothetical protein SteCoe_37176 [Stentor coeruleus]|uniref:EGF-like domain-containing protein n=1 Tax=Stentor coeruleus TaxID=5963 RepID=A0A1R2ANK4_9CILI|nr:hypothetical protein SteCoe_37176 [Stentor coeruleus]